MPTKTLIVSFLEPTQRPWRLFGASRLARYIDKPSIPSQCDKCWGFHARHSCDQTARCRRCGKTDHRGQECAAPEQCANCLGPHCADDPKCPARPKRVHGMVRRLTREERRLVRQAGAQLFAQQKRQTPNHNVAEQSRRALIQVNYALRSRKQPERMEAPAEAPLKSESLPRPLASSWPRRRRTLAMTTSSPLSSGRRNNALAL
ncbi:hypothetical protein HIM_09942 [Hirsutella minnesotensis 3608]|uniref:CCHC-type domain-containing protein n=1 Tax=Hirsutella minnesotensis 3608 TaxID=1043627 RepID=A0A0F8A2T2_9HYPO|nr:hypothetical protein HIM_09942 [Hirsutella minnesotensis 3608]